MLKEDHELNAHICFRGRREAHVPGAISEIAMLVPRDHTQKFHPSVNLLILSQHHNTITKRSNVPLYKDIARVLNSSFLLAPNAAATLEKALNAALINLTLSNCVE